MVTVQDILNIIFDLAPANLSYDWDNVGLQLGSGDDEVKRVLITLDINHSIIDEAIDKGCQLIISHHPFLYKGIKTIDIESWQGSMISKCIKNGINVMSHHTNLDIARGGLNDYLTKALKIKNCSVISSTYKKEYVKFVVFVPEDYLDIVRQVILESGAGYIGNYSHTSFASSGCGSFLPLKGSNPFLGKQGELNLVKEKRLETIIPVSKIDLIVSKMKSVHPYDEIAYDLYPLKNNYQTYGLGRIGQLEKPVLLRDYLILMKKTLNIIQIKYTGNINKKLKKVAVCSGNGADLIRDVSNAGADLYISADIKYHQAQLAERYDLALVDVGHFESENIVKDLLKDYLENSIEGVNILKSEINTNPWNYN